MKSEERHRLNTNELGQTVQVVGHRLEQHATTIVAVVCGILLIAAAVTWWSRQSNSSAQKAWTELENAQNVNDFGEVAETFKGSPAGRWALLRESELNLQSGLSAMFSDREVALTDLKKAREGFETLTAVKPADPAVQERALWGLALALEATSDADTTKASDIYQRLLNEIPDTYYKPIAEQRIAALKTGGAKEFYAWFSKQNPKPVEQRPKDGSSKDPFDAMFPPPGKSEFSLEPNPPKSKGGKPGEAATKPESSETEKPAPENPADEPNKPETKPDDAPAAKEAPAAKDKGGDANPDVKPDSKTDNVPENKPATEQKPEQENDKKE